jgi:hypothetical protein
MPRFRTGDQVVIVGPIITHYLGKEGMVMEVKPSDRAKNRTLDRYLVEFSDSDRQWFFDPQLAPVDQLDGESEHYE